MKTLVTALLLILINLPASADSKRALFVGNSYTFFNNLPILATEVALSAGDTLESMMSAPGGMTLQGHSFNPETKMFIEQGNWDFVILQEQSQLPSFPIGQVMSQSFPYAEQLNVMIEENNVCGETMFFMTWGRKNGDMDNCPHWPPVCTYEGMDSLLNLRYMMMAENNNAVVSPVGAVWRYVRENHPEIELYDPDQSHPSPAGSYLAAVTFYTGIFEKDPTNISLDFILPPADAEKIRDAAKIVFFDNLSDYFYGAYELSSDFEYEFVDGYKYQFNNKSNNFKSVLWDFGDDTDKSSNATYTFPGPGEYTVKLTTYTDCDTAYSSQTITVILNSIEDNSDTGKILIYPNPANDRLYINMQSIEGVELAIYNTIGERVMHLANFLSNEIDISNLISGVYYVQLTSGVNSRTIEFIKQ